MATETKEVKLLDLDDAKKNMLANLKKFEKNQKKLVKENPYIEISDKESYEIGKKRRTALLKGRTGFTAQEKVIKENLNGLKNSASDYINNKLISITKPHEDKQQAEVKRYEAILEKQREEKAEKERKRVENIQFKLNDSKSRLQKIIDSVVFVNISEKTVGFNNEVQAISDGYVFEEFEIEFDEIVEEKTKLLDKKISDVKAAELKRKQDLSNQQEAQINSIFRKVTLVISNATESDIDTLETTVKEKLSTDFDFGTHEDKWLETQDILEQQAKDKLEALKSSAKSIKENQSRELESSQRSGLLTEQSKKLNALLGMNSENYEEVVLDFSTYESEMKIAFNKIPEELGSMISLLKTTQETKLNEVKKVLSEEKERLEAIKQKRVGDLLFQGMEQTEPNTIEGFGLKIDIGGLDEMESLNFNNYLVDIKTAKEDSKERKERQERLADDKSTIKIHIEAIGLQIPKSDEIKNEETISFVKDFGSQLDDFLKDKIDELENL